MANVFLVEEIVRPNLSHRECHKATRRIFPLTPEGFREAVIYSSNRSSRTLNGEVVYLVTQMGHRVAKLFQAKNHQGDMFRTFHYPDGEAWRIRARLPLYLESKPGAHYPSAI